MTFTNIEIKNILVRLHWNLFQVKSGDTRHKKGGSVPVNRNPLLNQIGWRANLPLTYMEQLKIYMQLERKVLIPISNWHNEALTNILIGHHNLKSS